MNPLRPDFSPEEFKTAAPENVVPVMLAFRENEYFKNEVLSELDTD